ncbi:MAG TPA: hypothetical protein VLJ86_16245 [Ramlibacter sp.]|nr:hypothetical protein [Ramlibacter sp.]
MNTETKTSSILQRVPIILAVTAASYGLQLPVQVLRFSQGHTATASNSTRQPARSGTALLLPAPARASTRADTDNGAA